jgi:hypothetical protein
MIRGLALEHEIDVEAGADDKFVHLCTQRAGRMMRQALRCQRRDVAGLDERREFRQPGFFLGQ